MIPSTTLLYSGIGVGSLLSEDGFIPQEYLLFYTYSHHSCAGLAVSALNREVSS